MNDTAFIEPLHDDDFSELLLRHMLLVPEIYNRAQALKLTGEDFMIDATYGNEVYKEIVNMIISAKQCPMSVQNFANGITARINAGLIDEVHRDSLIKLMAYFYDTSRPLEPSNFFDGKIAAFLQKRRATKIWNKHKDDLATATAELSRLQYSLSSDSESNSVKFIVPFRDIVYKSKTNLIGSGIHELDKRLGGLELGQFGFIVGFSGGGKTALGLNIVQKIAEGGDETLYLSYEEPTTDLSQRLYANVFGIRYTGLRQGQSNIELEAQANDAMHETKRRMLHKLHMADLRDARVKNVDHAYESIKHHYEMTGFIPKVVMLDQMQCLDPITEVPRGADNWQKEKVLGEELDELSHRTINGKNFVLWVQHQAKGKLKPTFSREDIDGYKGIIHKADIVLGVGKPKTEDCLNIFSLKQRHVKEFSVHLRTELEFMRVKSEVVRDTLDLDVGTSNPGSMTQVNTASIIPRR
jgi:hypothetical protein